MNNHLEIAILASLAAGKAIMEVYSNATIEVELKEDNSPITKADKKANKVINSFLNVTQIPIISEEGNLKPYSVRKNWNTCWIVDPLDGTKEFIKRNGDFTVNIALIKNNKPVLGVIYVPVSKVLYFADVTKKEAFKADLLSHDVLLNEILLKTKKIIPKVKFSEKTQLVVSQSHMNQETLSFIEELKIEEKKLEIISRGSSLKFCLLAEGKADIYPRFSPTMEWDTAAGQAICNAVDIKVISKKTNLPLQYNKENLLNSAFIASINKS